MAKAKDCSTKLEATVKERDFQLLSAQNSAEELRAELKEKVNPTEDTYPGGNLIYHIMFKYKNDELIASKSFPSLYSCLFLHFQQKKMIIRNPLRFDVCCLSKFWYYK